MSLTSKVVKAALSARRSKIDRFMNSPAAVQCEQLEYLLKMGERTLFGREHSLASVTGPEEFRRAVPVTDYEGFSSYISRAKAGEADIVWPGRVRWFAKSSGTTDSKSKYIPVTAHGLKESHMRGPRDVLALYFSLYPDNRMFSGKTLTLGGSKKVEREGETAFSGDLSAILIENTPWYANPYRVPSAKTALIPDFDQKVTRICEQTVKKNITAFAGVPSWNLVLMNRVLEYAGKDNLLEVWPNMELFMHGGVSFRPYREQYRKLIPSPDMHYMETYNASEGFFAISDDPSRGDMLLMLDYGTYYEFLPMSSIDDTLQAVPLEDVRQGVNYAMIITNSNGLWRYMIGDTVEFTSLSPYRIKITGRTKHQINVFGEEVVIDNADAALQAACMATGALVSEFTVAPVYMEIDTKGAHQWVIEFAREPSSAELFRETLDRHLQTINSDYEAKRFKNTTLDAPVITSVPAGTFMAWLRERGKMGGQNKIARLSNDRTFVEQLLAIAENGK